MGKLKVVLIGGGSGISSILRSLKLFNDFDISSISTATDDGGSTGKILKIYDDLIPLGDIRNCIASLAEDPILEELFQYRFDRAELNPHALGNLILLALYKMSNNNLYEFTEKVHRLFKIKGKALLSSTKRGILVAKINGKIIRGETDINRYVNENDEEIEEVFLEEIEDKDVNYLALDSIKSADVILVGPGSIYSSIIPNFLVRPIFYEYNKSKALKIYIANIVNQPNEFKAHNLSEYLKILQRYSISFDYVFFNNNIPSRELLEKYKQKDNRYELVINDTNLSNVIQKDLLDENKNFIRHSGIKVGILIKKIMTK